MTSPLHDRIEAAMAELEQQRVKIRDLEKSAASTTATVQSKNRMVTATVDRSGKLTELRFEGKRYRTIAPAELSAVVLETVQQAQEEVARQAIELVSSVLPNGFNPFGSGGAFPDISKDGTATPPPIDLDAMIASAMELLNVPLLQDQMRTEQTGDAR